MSWPGFGARDFLGQSEGFLITLGVPTAAWCGVMLADIATRRADAAGRDGDLPLSVRMVGDGPG